MLLWKNIIIIYVFLNDIICTFQSLKSKQCFKKLAVFGNINSICLYNYLKKTYKNLNTKCISIIKGI